MKYKKIKELDAEVSQLIFGSAAPAFIAGKEQNELLDCVLDTGINIIDTARNYGLSEKTIGIWLKQGNKRDRIILLSKCGHPDTTSGADRINESDILEDLNTSLTLLNTDYLDIYLLHRDDLKVPVEEIVEIMNKLVKQGKIRCYGVSNWTTERIEQANAYAKSHQLLPISISSPNYCIAKKVINPWLGNCVSLCGEENNVQRQYYQYNQMPVFAYSSLGRGMFTGRVKSNDQTSKQYLDEFAQKSFYNEDNLNVLRKLEELAKQKQATIGQLALSFLLHSPLNVFPIISSSSPNRLKENLKAFEVELTEAELAKF